MTRYFLHLRDHIDEIFDAEGIDLPSLDALKKAVIEAARDIMTGDLRNGVLDLRYRIDAQDEQGAVIFSLPFQHAISIIPAQ
jgi:hypothetical protein